MRMSLWNETKSIPISRQMVWTAYKKVRANKGSAGVDSVSMQEFDAYRSRHLYKLWNRMASGSYFPPPVKEVEIPKKDGKVRQLGIPTIRDRVGQMVIKDYLDLVLKRFLALTLTVTVQTGAPIRHSKRYGKTAGDRTGL